MSLLLRSKVLFILLLLLACEDRLDVEVESGPPRLVVDGYVTDLDKPTEVVLSWTNGYDSKFRPSRLEGAGVCLFENGSECIELQETKKGIYSSAGTGFRADRGKRYHIEIVLPDGRKYASSPELLKPASGIQSAHFKYMEKEVLNAHNYLTKVAGIQLYADVHNPEEEENFSRFTWKGAYEFIGPLDPLNRKCWVTEEGLYDRFLLLTDTNYESAVLRDREIGFIKADYRFLMEYGFEIQQFELSPQAYQFFKKTKDQLDREGSLTDPPPYRVLGNVRNVEDEGEEVLGYFYAAGVDIAHVFVKARDLAVTPEAFSCDGPPIAPPPPECLNCIAMKDSSYEPPYFW